ncbi:uncharacterized protein LY79DRAFT_564441 [Colletotrichum navitas]|uniref:Uncharacterized protein n=1 Tax=Colletotrichum navitas TaxID=681940 RepID=A0AAD8PRJ2_9PEZI|nr:uncharacterized protein LY79DRAFT_564441 [Colletotrichum navitas]KAK1579408.1 hypothetical protein LY79DRAFT_564441 [Colletotrichum navitas]
MRLYVDIVRSRPTELSCAKSQSIKNDYGQPNISSFPNGFLRESRVCWQVLQSEPPEMDSISWGRWWQVNREPGAKELAFWTARRLRMPGAAHEEKQSRLHGQPQ